MESLVLVNATTPAQIEAIRALFLEYQADLKVDLRFQHFSEELVALPGVYAPPRGRLVLASVGDTPVGCAALRPLVEGPCEMKRLFVRPSFRGRGIGRRLATHLIREAKQAGYTTMLLDTLATMKEAQQLYITLGFTETPAYTFNPIPGTRYFILALENPPSR